MNFYKSTTIKAGIRISRYLTDRGVKVHGNRAVAEWRGGERESVSIDDDKQVWHDHVTDEGGDVITLCKKLEGLDFLAACRTLGDRYRLTPDKVSKKPAEAKSSRRDQLLRDGFKLVKTYGYISEIGTPLYYVERWERQNADGSHEKTFAQYHIENGRRIDNLKDVRRMLYNLPNVVKAEGDIYLVEGEKDADTLNALGLVATTNSGGCEFWTPELTAYLNGKRVIVIADNDDAGQAGARTRATSLVNVAASVKVITLSALPKGDVTDWLEREGGTVEKLREIVANAAPFNAPVFERFGHKVDGDWCNGCDTYGRTIFDIDGCGSYFATVNAGHESIRAAVSRNAAEIVKRIVEAHKSHKSKGGVEIPAAKMNELTNAITVMWLRSRGRLFWNAQTKAHADSMFFDNAQGRLYKIESDFFQSKIANSTDISRSGQSYKALRTLIQDAAVCPDVAAGVVPSKYYDRRGDALYVSNGDSEMVRVTATDVTTLRNGTDDVIFLEGYTLPKWTLLDGEGEDPFDAARIFDKASYLTASGKMLLRLWWLSLFAKMPKRPPLLITAPFHSGKTKLFDGVNTLLANRAEANVEITDTPQGKIDFWTAIHAGGLYCIDNADSHVSWLSDTLQRVSTGSALPKRKLYKDDELVCLYPNADIVVTSNNPQFADDCGLSDRFIIVRLTKRSAGEASADAALTDDLLKRRDAALTWTVQTLQRALAIPPDAEAGGRINGRHPDFATFALRCADALDCRREAENALKAAELDKSLIVLQNAEVARDILTFLRTASGKWEGKASDLARVLWPDIQDSNDRAIRSAGIDVAKAIKKYADQFNACFNFDITKAQGFTIYHFFGIDERLKTTEIVK